MIYGIEGPVCQIRTGVGVGRLAQILFCNLYAWFVKNRTVTCWYGIRNFVFATYIPGKRLDVGRLLLACHLHDEMLLLSLSQLP
jgi:hypothetical protein